MFPNIYFWTEEANFEKVREMLKSQFGLIPPINDPAERTEREILVYTENKFGIYRVHFNAFHKDGSCIGFRDWYFNPDHEIWKRNPMKEAVKRTYELLRPVRVTGNFQQDLDLESLLSP